MTKAQIDQAVNSGQRGARDYFDACGRWIKSNWASLNSLHRDFEAETHTKMDLSTFCSQMFNETHEGI